MTLQFAKPVNLKAKRKEYTLNLVMNACKTLAQELIDGDTTREIGIVALGQIWASANLNSGQGHAKAMESEIESTVDGIIASMDSDDAQEDDVEAA